MPYGIVRLIDRRQPAIFTALPPTAFLLRKNSAGLFDEGKSDDDKEESRRNTCVLQGSMTQSALICAWGPRKVARPCGVRRTHHSGEPAAPRDGALAIQAAGHHGAVAQHPELIPQAVAEALSPALPGGQLRPIKTLAVFQKDALRQPEALPHRLPFPRKRPATTS